MINYKKSLMSIAAVLALSSASLTANYIPLTGSDAGTDEKWVLFGVTGLKTSGAGAGSSAGVFSIESSPANQAIDLGPNETNELFTNGFSVGSNSLGKVKAISVSRVEVRVDTTDLTWNETEPVHTMYIKMTESATGPAFAVTYKAALEGQTMQYSVESDGSNAHTITLSSAGTYRNPGLGEVIQDVEGLESAILSKFSDAADFNLTNNPPASAYYDKAEDQDAAATGEYLRVYSYDAQNVKWDLFDTRNEADVNDFSQLEKGKSYWAKMNLETTDRQAGLVLSSSSISSDEYLAAGITTGWNMVAFSADNGETVRKASTGLIVTLDGSDTISIWDSSANHTVTADVNNTDATTIRTSCYNINQSVKQAKINGLMPETFDLKAFPIAGNDVVLVSNGRFMISDGSTGAIAGVTTLTGDNPYTVADVTDITQTDDTNAITLDNTFGAMSKYGEYAMFIEPLTGIDTASETLAEAKMNLQNVDPNDFDAGSLAAPIQVSLSSSNVASDLTLTGHGGADYTANAIDTDYDGAVEKVLIASTKPFYVRDHTFTRVFSYSDVDADSSVKVTGVTSSAIDVAVNGVQNVDVYADALDIAGGVNFSADDADTDKVIIITSATDASKFDVTENVEIDSTDQLLDASTSVDLAKGAVKGVYSLDAYVTAPTVSVMSIDVNSSNFPNNVADTVAINLTSSYGITATNLGAQAVGDYNATANSSGLASTLKTLIEAELLESRMTGTVTVVNDTTDVNITITSSEVANVALTWSSTNASSTEGQESGGIVEPTPDLAADLKFNPVYVPNYMTAGPLYTMMDAGYELKAMVTGSTDLSSANAAVSWESIDLTRAPSEWLDSQDYSLFSTHDTAGYWAYLEPATEEVLSVVNVTFVPTYVSHINVNGVTYNNLAGPISIEVDGLPQVGDANYDDSAVVLANINGERVELVKQSTNNVFAGEISTYELESLTAGSDYPIKITMANGLGSNLLNEDSGKSIDMTKPIVPTIDLGDGSGVTFASTSEDVAGYYIFDGQAPDYNTLSGTNLITYLTADDATGYALCSQENIDRLTTWNADAYALNVFAVDGSGVFGKGNVSDAATKNFIPMLKSAVKLTDVNNGANDSTTMGNVYGADCSDGGAQTVDYGMQLTSLTNLETVILAYSPKNGSDTAAPITVYVKGAGSVAEITYSDIYVGEVVYIEIEGNVYSYELKAVNTEGVDSATPVDLTNSANATLRADQKLSV